MCWFFYARFFMWAFLSSYSTLWMKPFFIPEFELTMAWSPLLQHHPAHRWLRQLIMHVARQIVDEEDNPPQEIPIINHLF